MSYHTNIYFIILYFNMLSLIIMSIIVHDYSVITNSFWSLGKKSMQFCNFRFYDIKKQKNEWHTLMTG